MTRFRRGTMHICTATLIALSGAVARGDLAAGLAGYWRLEGGGADDSGRGRDLTLFGGIGFATGLNGEALELPGEVNQYAARTADDAVFDFAAGDFTVSQWVYYNKLANEQIIVEKFEGRDGPGWTFTKLAGNQLRLHADGLASVDTGVLALSAEQWNHFLVRRIGGTVEVFWNGAIQASKSVSGAISDTTNPLLVGQRNKQDGRDFPMNGRIDELAIWTRGLTDDEVATVYNNGAGGTIPVIRRGDMNCDGAIDFNDIDPFVLALTGEDNYQEQFPDCHYQNGDISCDGSVDFDDIDAFVECVVNEGCGDCP